MTSTDRPVAVVTGAAGGLGEATCRRLVRGGWQVVAADVAGPRLDALAAVGTLEAEPLDITDRRSVDDLARRVGDRHAAVRAVVSFAGILEVGSMVELPESVVARVLDVNLFGTDRVNQPFVDPVGRCRGRMMSISSETGWQSGPLRRRRRDVEARDRGLQRLAAPRADVPRCHGDQDPTGTVPHRDGRLHRATVPRRGDPRSLRT